MHHGILLHSRSRSDTNTLSVPFSPSVSPFPHSVFFCLSPSPPAGVHTCEMGLTRSCVGEERRTWGEKGEWGHGGHGGGREMRARKGKVEGEERVGLLKRKTNVLRKERGVEELFPLAFGATGGHRGHFRLIRISGRAAPSTSICMESEDEANKRVTADLMLWITEPIEKPKEKL